MQIRTYSPLSCLKCVFLDRRRRVMQYSLKFVAMSEGLPVQFKSFMFLLL